MIKDINPGPASSNPGQLANAGGTLYFLACDADHTEGLWKSNGTAGTTVQVKAHVTAGCLRESVAIVLMGGALFFMAQDRGGRDIWRSDGTAGGTKPLFDGADPGYTFPNELTAVGGSLYFTAVVDNFYHHSGRATAARRHG